MSSIYMPTFAALVLGWGLCGEKLCSVNEEKSLVSGRWWRCKFWRVHDVEDGNEGYQTQTRFHECCGGRLQKKFGDNSGRAGFER